MDINSAVGRKAGLTDEKSLSVTSSAHGPHNDFDFSLFSETERLVIELADAMADTPSNVSDDLYQRLRQHFSEVQLPQLSAHIAFENYRARLNRVFDVESDDLYAPSTSGKRQQT